MAPSDDVMQQATYSETDQTEFLKLEAEHFYKAELHSEQRASWLLSVALGAQALVLNAFTAMYEHRLSSRAAPGFVVCTILLFLAIGLALIAIWPLSGARGIFARPWSRSSGGDTLRSNGGSWEKHYEAHRLRAEIKTIRVTWTLMALIGGLVAGTISILINAVAL